jgi:molybdenum cofactor synthesis domain-containing protein
LEWDLLEKTNFWIEDVHLKNANLDEIAQKVSKVLGMTTAEIMVVDVRPGLLAFDIMKRKVQAESVIGKEEEILSKLAEVHGVRLGSSVSVHSEGILGLIALDPEEADSVLKKSEKLTEQVKRAVSKRAKVFASGTEIIDGKVEDTNSPYIMKSLEDLGYKVKFGGALRDDVIAAQNGIEGALEEGYGLIVTTGGVGAENKDFSVEAILRIDKNACTPWILKFKPDYHRHHKEGVRIGVGKVGMSYVVALPGPHEEAKLGCNALIKGIKSGLDKNLLAETIASALRRRWIDKMK